MSGDRLVAEPMFTVTHAITIDAPPERIWPWLAQMGALRGGWYSYDRIDNGGRASADRVLSEYQQPVTPDVVPKQAVLGQRLSRIEYLYRLVGRLPDCWLIAIAGMGHRWMEARHMRGIKRLVEAQSRADRQAREADGAPRLR